MKNKKIKYFIKIIKYNKKIKIINFRKLNEKI